MKHISIEMKEPIHNSRPFNSYFEGLRIGVLDIETTGLDPIRNEFILGGLYDVQEERFHQVFAQDITEERDALDMFEELIAPLDVVITYNGRRFDMPFLRQRHSRSLTNDAYTASKGKEMPELYDLDLYQVVRKHSPLRRLLPNLRQKTVEDYMGLWQSRTDEISGAESVDLYWDYTRTKDPEKERKILLHNSDDVCQLTRLTRVIDKCDFHSAMYHLGFPVRHEGMDLRVGGMRIMRNVLHIEGSQGRNGLDYRSYETDGCPIGVAFAKESGSFDITIPVTETSGLTVADLRALKLDESEFEPYPGCDSGFIVLRNIDRNESGGPEVREQIMYRECNHLARSIIKKVAERICGY